MDCAEENVTFNKLITLEEPQKFVESAYPFMKLMMQYQCAMLEVQTKFEVLNQQLSLESDRNSIESISCRLKKTISIIEKLKRKNLAISLESVEKYLYDVAGVRVICSFTNDIYQLADKICSQDDIHLIKKKDYIESPKENGYRSLHLIVEIPVFFADERKWIPVEVQFRTIAMDFWASIEHKVHYKKNLGQKTADISEKLRICAEGIHSLDLQMQEIGEFIEMHRGEESKE